MAYSFINIFVIFAFCMCAYYMLRIAILTLQNKSAKAVKPSITYVPRAAVMAIEENIASADFNDEEDSSSDFVPCMNIDGTPMAGIFDMNGNIYCSSSESHHRH